MNGRDDKQDANLNDEEGLVSEESSSAGTSGAQAEDLAKLQAEKDALAETLVRRQADFENYRKRIERERAEEGRRAQSRLIEDLLPVLDGFERALSAHDDPAYEEYRKGLEIIYKQLWDTLARHGLERIEAAGKTRLICRRKPRRAPKANEHAGFFSRLWAHPRLGIPHN